MRCLPQRPHRLHPPLASGVLVSPTRAFVPLSFDFVEAFHFDWSDEDMVVGGVFYYVQAAHLELCGSWAFWLMAHSSQGHKLLFDAHSRSFQALGGVTRLGIYDIMRTAVEKVQRGDPGPGLGRTGPRCYARLFWADGYR